MHELKSIALAAEELRKRAEPFLLATVVRVRGSSYRRPGARMLITRDEWVAGCVSGGCVERDVLQRGWWRTRDGAPCLITYDGRSEDVVESGLGARLGVGCDGTVEVLLEPEGRGRVDPLAFIATCCHGQRRGALATIFGGAGPLGAHVSLGADGSVVTDDIDELAREAIVRECQSTLRSGRSNVVACVSRRGSLDTLVEAILPPPRLFIVGAGHDAVPLVSFARTLGWEITVCDSSARFATRERFAHADEIVVATPREVAERASSCDRGMVVVMAHDYERDRACLDALLKTSVSYLGMLGPRRRTERMFDELGIDPALFRRVHAPIGLAIGAETPEEIALAIISEAQAVLTGSRVVSLSERAGPIHSPGVPLRAAV